MCFNSTKCAIFQSQITFYGFLFIAADIMSDTAKAMGIAYMPPHMDDQPFQSFLRMINLMWPLVPHMSHHTALLRVLLKENNTFTWDEGVNQAFWWLKALMT